MTKISIPVRLMLLISVIILLVNYFVYRGATMDIHLHDTYFVVDSSIITLLLSCFLALETLLYFITSSYRQFCLLQYLHIATILLFWVACLVFHFMPAATAPAAPAHYYNLSAYETSMQMPHLVITIALLLLITGQLLFAFNLLAGFIRGKKTTV
jgi:heme/copper-type cytochrome/quinol oxidase subunit 1